MRPVPHSRHYLAAILFAAVAAASGYLAMLDYRLSQTQVDISTAAIKRSQPSLFAQDPVYGPVAMWRFGSPAFQGLLEMSLAPTAYQDLSLPYRLMTPLAVLLYLSGMYALLYRQCRSWSIAAFVSILSMTIIYALGRSYWGLGSLGSITPAALYRATIPLILLTYLRLEHSWRVVLVFLFIGLAGNIHLATAGNLTLTLGLTMLARHKFRPRVWPRVLVCGLAATAGAMPYLGYYLALRHALPAEAIDGQAVVAALNLIDNELLYPDILRAVLYWLLLVGVLLIPAAAVLSRMERFKVRDLSLWVAFGSAALLVALVFHGLSQLYGVLTAQPPPMIDFAEASCLALLPLYVLVAQALTDIFRLVRANRAVLRWCCAALMAAWMIPSDNLRVARHAALDLASTFMNEADKPRQIQRHHDRFRQWAELSAIAEWARQNTPEDATFMAEPGLFRMLSRRALAACEDDVKIMYYMAPWRLGEYLGLIEQQSALLNPPTGKADEEAILQFLSEHRRRQGPQDARQYYVVIETPYAPGTETGLEAIANPAWGTQYMLLKLK